MGDVFQLHVVRRSWTTASTAGSWSAPSQLFDLGPLLWGCWFPSMQPSPDVAEGPVCFLGWLVQWLELLLLCWCQSLQRIGSGHQEQHFLLLAASCWSCSLSEPRWPSASAEGHKESCCFWTGPLYAICNCSVLPWCLSGVSLVLCCKLVCPLTRGSCSLSRGLILLLASGWETA